MKRKKNKHDRNGAMDGTYEIKKKQAKEERAKRRRTYGPNER